MGQTVNSHYIPKFIIKSFCNPNNNNHITYCNIKDKQISYRNPKSVFCEDGYYPLNIEKALNKKVEQEFSKLYCNKLENATNKIILTRDELILLKKYLIVTQLRYKNIYGEQQEDIRNAYIKSGAGDMVKSDFTGNIKKILNCNTLEDMVQYVVNMHNHLLKHEKAGTISQIYQGDKELNIELFQEIQDVLYSYIVFIKTSTYDELVLPDTARGVWCGPLTYTDKLSICMKKLMQNPSDKVFAMLGLQMTNHDYSIFPITKHLAILSINPFYKLFTNTESRRDIQLPSTCNNLSKALGFRDLSIIAPAKNNLTINNKVEYEYNVNKLDFDVIAHFNRLMIVNTYQYIGCSDLSRIQFALYNYYKYTDKDLSFMKI